MVLATKLFPCAATKEPVPRRGLIEHQTERDVVEDSEKIEECVVLINDAAVPSGATNFVAGAVGMDHHDGAASGRVGADDRAKQGRLSAPVRTDQANRFARPNA